MNRIEEISQEAAIFAANKTQDIRAGAGFMQTYNLKFAELLIIECNARAQQYIAECGEVNSLPDHVILTHFGLSITLPGDIVCQKQ